MNTVNNQALVEAGLVSNPPMLPPARSVKRGKSTVLVQDFAPTGGAKEISAKIKQANPKLSAKQVTQKVNEVLRGEVDLREQLALAWVQGCFQQELVPTVGERTKSGALLRMKEIPTPKPVVAALPPAPKTREDIMAAIASLQAQAAALPA